MVCGTGPTVVFVEGESDKAALMAVAAKTPFGEDHFTVTVMGGITNVARLVGEAVAAHAEVAGVYDAGAEDTVAAALTRAGRPVSSHPDDLEAAGFFRCDPDLEAELISALGGRRVVDVVASQGTDLRRLRSLQQMPEWRGRTLEDQLRRWFGSGGRRKVRYAELLCDAMSLDEVPRPLLGVLARAKGGGMPGAQPAHTS